MSTSLIAEWAPAVIVKPDMDQVNAYWALPGPAARFGARPGVAIRVAKAAPDLPKLPIIYRR